MEGEQIGRIRDVLNELEPNLFENIPDLQKMVKILRNILEHPFESKYRSLNLKCETGKRMWENESCHIILEIIGFVYEANGDSIHWVLPDHSIPIFILEETIREVTLIVAQQYPSGLFDILHESSIQLDQQGQSPLHHAAASGDYQSVKLLSERYPHLITLSDINGWIPIFEAIRSNEIDIVLFIIEFESNLYFNQTSSTTPLSPTTHPNSLPSFLSHRTPAGFSALDWSKHFHQGEIESILLSAQDNFTSPSSSSSSISTSSSTSSSTPSSSSTSLSDLPPLFSSQTTTRERVEEEGRGDGGGWGQRENRRNWGDRERGRDWGSSRPAPPPPPPNARNRRGPWG